MPSIVNKRVDKKLAPPPGCVVWISLIVFLFMTGLTAQTEKARHQDPTGDDLKALEKWAATLGLPDPKCCTFVEVETGNWTRTQEGVYNQTIHAYLLKEDGRSFTILDFQGATTTLKRTPKHTPSYKRVRFQRSDLATAVKQCADGLRVTDESRPIQGEHTILDVFFLAWGARGKGQDREADELLTLLRSSLPEDSDDGRPLEKPGELLSWVQDELGTEELWRIILDMGRPDIPWAALLNRLSNVSKNFPRCRYHAEMTDYVASVSEIVHKMDNPLGQTATDLPHFLVGRLTEQNGRQISFPGACDILADPRKGRSPAVRLLKLSDKAVPALLEALDDRRPTRCIQYQRPYFFSHYPLRVQDCAAILLEAIAGQSFAPEEMSTSCGDVDGHSPAATAPVARSRSPYIAHRPEPPNQVTTLVL